MPPIPFSDQSPQFLLEVLNAIPIPIFLVDRDAAVVACNQAGADLAHDRSEKILRRRAGEVLHCINSSLTPGGCGHARPCGECVIRSAVNESFAGRRTVRKKTRMILVGDTDKEICHLLVTCSPLHPDASSALGLLILEDVSAVIALGEILSICSHCRKIRADNERWENIENYLHHKLEVDFSHGICPECRASYYSD